MGGFGKFCGGGCSDGGFAYSTMRFPGHPRLCARSCYLIHKYHAIITQNLRVAHAFITQTQ